MAHSHDKLNLLWMVVVLVRLNFNVGEESGCEIQLWKGGINQFLVPL